MAMSWADSVSAAENPAGAASKSAYVPPHLRNRPSIEPPAQASYAGAAALGNDHSGYGVPNVVGSRWSGQRTENRSGYVGGGGRGGGWNGGRGGWDRGREREVNPFTDEDSEPFSEKESSGINFDAYEDIPVETSGDNVPPPVNTFAEIDLGEAVNQNIRRCKYVKPTPVQRHAIPIVLSGKDLMACAQTGSGKTAAFCFPIISGIMRGQFPRPPCPRVAFPLALILSPTRELSCQVSLWGLLVYALKRAGERRTIWFFWTMLYGLIFKKVIECHVLACRSMMKLRNSHIKLVSGWLLLMVVLP